MEEVNMEEVTPTPIESEDDREGIKEEVLLTLLKRQGEPAMELEEVGVVVEDVVELADYTKGDLCKNDRIEEMEIYDEEIFDGFDKLENNKSEL